MKTYTDKPYDEAKKRWITIFAFGGAFAVFTVLMKHGIIPYFFG